MEDIICTIPWHCGDKNCSVQWHLRHFWTYDDGTYSECDSDGNHDDIDAEDIPSADDQRRAWREYSAHVAETGEDPLGEFTIKRHIVRRETWRFKIVPSILGAVVTQAQRARKFYWPRELPDHVRQYLNLRPGNHALQDFPTWQSFIETFPDHKPGKWFYATLEHKVPRKPEIVARELRAGARKALAR